jgi:hypothetical protein
MGSAVADMGEPAESTRVSVTWERLRPDEYDNAKKIVARKSVTMLA